MHLVTVGSFGVSLLASERAMIHKRLYVTKLSKRLTGSTCIIILYPPYLKYRKITRKYPRKRYTGVS